MLSEPLVILSKNSAMNVVPLTERTLSDASAGRY
jgi:hypothetical protein